jgi:putative transposase
VTVSRDAVGRYFVSIRVKESIAPKSPSTQAVGVDLGLTHFATLSDGTKVDHPKFIQCDLQTLTRAQRALSRKQPRYNNRSKARQKVARIQARIADRRRDFLHQLSTRLIDENQVICVEDLAVKNMGQNRSLTRAIADSGWGEFVRQLAYKATWYGRTLQVVGRFFPSSKRCSRCGHRLEALPLSVRQWTCPVCGVRHDRDVNAACNILAEGPSVSACGAPVSPQLALAGASSAR